MICPKCGKENPEGANFCSFCGASMKELQPVKDIEPTKIEPTHIEPTHIEATKIEPTHIEPTHIEPTVIEATRVEPTRIEPTKIEPTKIEPTDISKPLKQPKKAGYSPVLSWTFLIIMFGAALAVLIWGIKYGLDFGLLVFGLLFLFSMLGFFACLKAMPITQEELDRWSAEIHKKNPKLTGMTMEDTKHIMNRFSYWLHLSRHLIVQIPAGIAFCASFVFMVVGVGVPVIFGGGIGGSLDVNGLYVSDACGSVNGNAQLVSVTAIKFTGETSYNAGPYDCNKKTFDVQSSGNYSKSGKTISFSSGVFKGQTLTIVSSSKLRNSQGTVTFVKA